MKKRVLSLVTGAVIATSVTSTSMTAFAANTMTTHENFASYGSGCTGYGFDAEVTYSNALAEECKGDPGFGIHHIPYEKQLQYFLDDPNLTAAQKDAAVIAINEAIQMRDAEPVMKSGTSRTTYTQMTIPVTAYTQEYSYYCGPATARQTLQYLGEIVPGTYSPPSQTTIAQAVHTSPSSGTEWYYLIAYINRFNFMNTPHSYIEHPLGTIDEMETIIFNSLNQDRPEPPILQIDTNNDSVTLGYPTDGHYLNVSGIRTKNGVNEFQLTDPYRQFGTLNLDPKYYVETSDIYRFTDYHWAEHFMC